MACVILAVSFRSLYISVDSMMLVVNDWTSEGANQPASQPTTQLLKYVCVPISSMVMNNTGFFYFELFCCSIFVCSTSIFIDITMQLRRMLCSSFKNRNGSYTFIQLYVFHIRHVHRQGIFPKKFLWSAKTLSHIKMDRKKKLRKAQREVTDVMWLNMMNETFNRCYHDVKVKPSINQIFTEKQPLYI